MLRPQGSAQHARRRIIGQSVSDLDTQELLRVRTDHFPARIFRRGLNLCAGNR